MAIVRLNKCIVEFGTVPIDLSTTVWNGLVMSCYREFIYDYSIPIYSFLSMEERMLLLVSSYEKSQRVMRQQIYNYCTEDVRGDP